MTENPEHHELKRCAECGKLFRASPDRRLCHACAHEPVAPPVSSPLSDEVATPVAERRVAAMMALYDAYAEGQHQGLIPNQAWQPILDPTAFAQGEGECILCGKPPLQGSEFCFECQSRLHQDFAEAAKSVHENINQPQQAGGNVRGLITQMAEHRSRVYNSRVNPYPMRGLRTD